MKLWAKPFLSTLAIMSVACVWAGGSTRVIYSNIQTSDTSLIPGLGGLRFKTGTTTQFDRVYCSADGSRWVLRAVSTEAATADDVLISGMGVLGSSGLVVLDEGTPAPWDGSLNVSTIRQQMAINNLGQIAFSCDTSAATTADDFVVRLSGNTYAVLAREGDTIPGSGLGFGSTNDSVHILNNGNVKFRSAFLVGMTADDGLITMVSPGAGSLDAQTSTFSPANQNTTPQFADVFSAGSYRHSQDGSISTLAVDLTGPTATDICTVINGGVIGQEGFVLGSFVSPVTSMDTAAGTRTVANNAHYSFRGSNVDTIDFVYKDGAVVAQTDAPIFSGAAENFDDTSFAACFFLNSVNGNGDFVVGGTTNNADATKNAVVVLNNRFEVIRESDPVDVDGDGQFDDDAFISVFNNDDCVLTDDLRYYFMADLKNSAGASLGQAFMVKQLGFQPISYNIVSGQYFGGTVASLCYSDDDQLFIINDENQPNGIVEFVIPTPYSSASSMMLSTELSATRDDLAVFVDFKNQNTLAFEVKDVFSSEFTDTLRRFELTNAANYINLASGNVDLRIRWIPAEDLVAEDGWSERIDYFNWVLN